MPTPIVDHNGKPVDHGRAQVNGVRLHYVIGGSGDPLFLLHGVPKTHYHWRYVIPLLTEHFTVIAPDLRGLGDSQHPESGYDMRNMGEDIAQLATHLGYETFEVAGEDWGASTAYQLAAAYPERVKKLCYQEMILPGYGLEDYSFLTHENVSTYVWLWHINFYNVPGLPGAAHHRAGARVFHLLHQARVQRSHRDQRREPQRVYSLLLVARRPALLLRHLPGDAGVGPAEQGSGEDQADDAGAGSRQPVFHRRGQ